MSNIDIRSPFASVGFYKNDNKKVLQPIMKSEGVQSMQGCILCKQPPKRLMRLPCGHGFCLKCLTFTYHKHSTSMNKPTLTRCIICQRTCELPQPDMNSIMEYTNQVLVPLVREEQERQGQSQFQLSNNQLSTGKQFKSHEMSTQKVTPAGKGFYSRCESPKAGFGQAFCQVHPEQELSIVCFSCSNSLLCISCIANKKHSNHNIKTILKGIDTIQQQVALSRLKGKEHLDRLEISKRRLEQRRNYLQQKWDKTLNSLRVHFNNLLQLANRKCEEVLESYSSFYEQSMQEAIREGAKVDQALRHARRQLERLNDVSQAPGSPIELIRKSSQIMETLKEMRQPQLSDTQELGHCDSERVIRDVVHICERLQKVEAQCTRQTLKTHAAQNWKSEQKHKDTFKRVKTNIMSLNSSRDRKQKKCTKTQQDEKRNKSRANYKTESSKLLKVNKDFPAYLMKHQNRDVIPDESNPFQSSFKSTSKVLSKSHLPSAADEHRRKKEHQTYIKDCLERKERKTFNATSKEGRSNNDPMRKKKIPA